MGKTSTVLGLSEHKRSQACWRKLVLLPDFTNRKLEIPTNREDFLCGHGLSAHPARAGCGNGALRVW